MTIESRDVVDIEMGGAPASRPVTDLTDWDWVALAADSDAVSRPVLRGILATEDRLVATDGHRIHIAPNRMIRPGLWDHKTHEPIQGEYARWEHCVPSGPATHEAPDGSKLRQIVKAAVAFATVAGYRSALVTFPTLAHAMVFDPRYADEALAGMTTDEVRLTAGVAIDGRDGASSPIKLEAQALGRIAIVMPVLVSPLPDGTSPILRRFDLAEFFRPAGDES